LTQLIEEKDLENAFIIINSLRRRACTEGRKRAYNQVHQALQEKMIIEYGAPLRLAEPFPL